MCNKKDEAPHFMIVSNIARYMINNHDVFEKGVRIKRNVKIWLTADKSLEARQHRITAFDIAVLDCIYTLFVNEGSNEEVCFSVNGICRILTEISAKNKVSPKIAQAVSESIEKMRRITIRIEKIDDNFHAEEYESYLLPVENITVTSKNNRSELPGYKLIGLSALYEYAVSERQIARITHRYLNLKNIHNTLETIIIGRYLLLRIMMMRNSHNVYKQHTITMDRRGEHGTSRQGLYPILGYFKKTSLIIRRGATKKEKLTLLSLNILSGLKKQV